MSKKVLHIKLDAPFFPNNGISKGFIDNDYQLVEFPFKNYRYQFGVEITRAKFIQLATQHKPDVIFMQIQEERVVDVDTAKELSKYGFVINYTFDCRTEEKSQWLYEIAPHIGLTLFSNQEDVEICFSKGIKNVMLFQSSCDVDVYKTSDIKMDFDVPDIVFFGQNYVGTNLDFPFAQERLNMVDLLKREYPNQFWPYGMGWDTELVSDPRKETFIYNNCKIAINQNNFDRLGYTSDRIWRAMSSGAFVLTKHFLGIEGLFQVGVHLESWKTFQELTIKIKEFLLNDDRRKAIAMAGQEYVRTFHSYTNRIKSLDHILNNMGVFSKQKQAAEGVIPTNIEFNDIKEAKMLPSTSEDEIPCKYGHTVKGQHVGSLDFQYENAICDCNRVIWVKDMCGCAEPHPELFQRENPNY